MHPIPDHSQRYALANELHARPFPAPEVPCRVGYLALKQESGAAGRDREADRALLRQLLDRYGIAHPPPEATHYSGQIGRNMLKWEQHSEFVTYTVFLDGPTEKPFDADVFDIFPADWLDQVPGVRMTSAVIWVGMRSEDEEIAADLDNWFVSESLAAAEVLEGAAVAASDFRIDPAGHMRFAIFVRPGAESRRVGRVVQRLCEIETYKAMSMLGFSRARFLSDQIGALDGRLTLLMRDMTARQVPGEETLGHLLGVSESLEALAAQSSYRFGATGAYEAIVNQRIEALGEARFMGQQRFSEFMMRRYEPAMRTVRATERRLEVLSDRAMRAGQLLRTRVEVERSAQNQALLESMDRRADLQLRLQHTVEGLSVVAISYYAVSLAGYLLYPLAGALDLSKGVMQSIVTVPVALGVWWAIRRIRKRLG